MCWSFFLWCFAVGQLITMIFGNSFDKSTNNTSQLKTTSHNLENITCSFMIDYNNPNQFRAWTVVAFNITIDSLTFLENNHQNVLHNRSGICYMMENEKGTNFTTSVYYEINEDNSTIHDSSRLNVAKVGEEYSIKPLKLHGPVVKCIAHHIGSPITFYRSDNEKKTEFLYTGNFETCEFTFSAFPLEAVGIWEITTYFIDEENLNHTINKQKEMIRIMGTEDISRFPEEEGKVGETAIVSIEKIYGKESTCNYYLKNDSQKYWAPFSKNLDKLESEERCGFRMEFYTWGKIQFLIMEIADDIVKDNYVNFHIKLRTNINLKMLNYATKHWTKGSNTSIHSNYNGSIACEVQKPDGYIQMVQSSQCKYNVGKVSRADEGVWIVRHYLPGKFILQEKRYIVNVWESESVKITVEQIKSSIKLTCINRDFPTRCSFTQLVAKKKRFFLGEIRYKNWDENNLLSECSLKLREYRADHHGEWKIEMTNKSLNQYIIRNFDIIKDIDNMMLTAEDKKLQPPRYTVAQYVLRKTAFKINCPGHKSLEYCRVEDSLGFTHSVIETKIPLQKPRYFDRQITVGDYGITVNSADDSHTGIWTLRYAVDGKTQITNYYEVHVVNVFATKNQNRNANNQTNFECKITSLAQTFEPTCLWSIADVDIRVLEDDNLRASPNRCYVELLDDSNPMYWGTWICRLSVHKTVRFSDIQAKVEIGFELEPDTKGSKLATHTDFLNVSSIDNTPSTSAIETLSKTNELKEVSMSKDTTQGLVKNSSETLFTTTSKTSEGTPNVIAKRSFDQEFVSTTNNYILTTTLKPQQAESNIMNLSSFLIIFVIIFVCVSLVCASLFLYYKKKKSQIPTTVIDNPRPKNQEDNVSADYPR